MKQHEDSSVQSQAMQPLRGRRALITGSTGGLGLVIAEHLALAGCDLMLTGTEATPEFQKTCRNLAQKTGTKVASTVADLSSSKETTRLVEAAQDELGGVDILVNNAVVRHFAPIVDFSVEKWDTSLAVNLSAAFHAIRSVLPGMRDQDFGRIFNITSVYGLRGTPDRVGYVTTKSALLGLTRSVALENLDYNVTCHSICPGSVLTPGTENRIVQMMTDDGVDRETAESRFLEGKQPSGKFVRPESVAATLLFLCGPVARDMTGAMLPVEGGWLVG